MNLALDSKKARTFDCNSCNRGLQKLRNCTGEGEPSKTILNGRRYIRCPKAIYISDPQAKFLVNLYMECREANTFPAEGSFAVQTAFTAEYFQLLDEMVHEWKAKREKEHEIKMKSEALKMKARR